MPKVDTLWYDIEARWDKLDAGVTQVQKKLSGLATFIKEHPEAAFAGLAATVAIVAYQLTKMGVEFDTTMRRVAASMPGGLAALAELKKGVLDLSKEMSGAFTPEQLAPALRQVIMQGGEAMQTPSAALERLHTAMGLARASGADLGTVVASLDDTMHAFGLEGGQAADQLSRLMFTASQGRAPLDEFAGLMTKLGPYARQAGIGIRELAALVAASFASGMPPQLAMRAFRQAIAGVDEEGRKVPKTAQDLGVELSTLNGSLEVGGRLGVEYQRALADLSGTMPQLGEALRTVNAGPGAEFAGLMRTLHSLAVTLGDKLAQMLPLHLFEITDEDRRILAVWNTLTAGGGGHAPTGTFPMPPAPGGFGAPRQPPVGPVRTGDAFRDAYAAPVHTPPPLTEAQLSERRKLLESLRERIAQTMGDTYTLVVRQLDAIEAQFHEKFGHTLPAEVTAGLARLRSEAGGDVLVGNLGRQMDALEAKTRAVAESGHMTTEEYEAQCAALAAEHDWLQLQLTDGHLTVEQQQQVRAQLTRIAELEQTLVTAKKAQSEHGKVLVKQDTDRLTKLQAQARTIEATARGALQLAQAFGLVDEKTASILENVAQAAANVPALLAAIAKGGTGGIITAALPVAGALAGLVTGLAGLFTESPEQKAARAALTHNSAAIEDLTRKIGNLGANITGSQYTGFLKALSATNAMEGITGYQVGGLKGGPLGQMETDWWNRMIQQLGLVGISLDDLDRIAKEAGIDLAGGATAMAQLGDALKKMELDQFAQTLAGQLDYLQQEFALFDVTDPVQQLLALQEAIDKLDAGALSQGLAGYDLSTAEGRAAAHAWLQDLFTQATSGGLTPEQIGALFGGMTPSEFLDAIGKLGTAIDAASAGAVAGGVGQTQWGVNQTITEATATRQLSLMETMAYWLSVIAGDTGTLAGRAVAPPAGTGALLTPPTAAELATFHAGAAGGGLTIERLEIQVTVEVAAGTSPATAAAVGTAVGEAAAAAVNRQLYQLAQRRARALGQATLSN
jgi:hypothetical protein